MVEEGLVRGMMLTIREDPTCDAYHLGKQKLQTRWKNLDRATNAPNQLVYAELIIPGQSNATKIMPVLIIMDGYSRFITIPLLTSKDSKKLNQHMQEYIQWAERQAGRHTSNCSYKVKRVHSDKGGDFCNMRWRLGIARKELCTLKLDPKAHN